MQRKTLERLLIGCGLFGMLVGGAGITNSCSGLESQSNEVKLIQLLEESCEGEYASEIHDELLSKPELKEEYKKRKSLRKDLSFYSVILIVSAGAAVYGSDLKYRRRIGIIDMGL